MTTKEQFNLDKWASDLVFPPKPERRFPDPTPYPNISSLAWPATAISVRRIAFGVIVGLPAALLIVISITC